LSNIVSEAVGVKFHPPKPSPLIVTDDPPLFARFALSRLLTLTNGAVQTNPKSGGVGFWR
jgi:hypothetical protein